MQSLETITANNNAQQAGFESGRLDAIIGHRSEYAWQCASDAPGYAHHYGVGYRLGWREAQHVKEATNGCLQQESDAS